MGRFESHGCIYFVDDLRSLTEEAEVDIRPAGPGSLGSFLIGPLVSRELWEGGRKDMGLDRGPC